MTHTKGSIRKSIRKVAALEMPLLGLIIQTLIYAWLWFQIYYPLVRLRLKFYRNGHLLVLLLYFVLLLFMTKTYGGLNVGYLKKFDVSLSQIFSLLIVNLFTYAQDSLLRNWLLPVNWTVGVTLVQIAFAIAWIHLSDHVYRRTFPPTELILIHGERTIEPILTKFESRPEKYRVVETIDIGEGIEAIEAHLLASKDKAAVLWDIPTQARNDLVKFCYANGIRQYMMPKITDVLVKGSEQLHLFDTPIYMTREYALSFEQRFMKRAIDIVCALILLIIASPIMLVTAVAIHAYDKGPVFYKQTRCTLNRREFQIIKFRSMRVDAEKDGVARLSAANDDRITPVGHFIRKVRIDELPQLLNILRGEMSFVGPRPERPEIIAQYEEEMPEFAFRMKVKAGLAGYAQIYGKYNTTPYDKLKLDLTYIQNYSIFLDLKLMLLTLKILFTPESTEGVAEGQVTAQHIAAPDAASDTVSGTVSDTVPGAMPDAVPGAAPDAAPDAVSGAAPDMVPGRESSPGSAGES